MDIEEFTKKFVTEKLREICHHSDCCNVCPFYHPSVESNYSCKLIQLDDILMAHGEEAIWLI